jgi:hypothetical protein
VRRPAAYLWAGPVSLAALPLAAAAAMTGGRLRIEDGVLEAGGGILRPLLTRGLPWFSIRAITLGHVVLGAGERELEACRAHERVHVAQYERWGFLFPILYAASSLAAVARGERLYEDNAYERQAVRRSEESASA